MTTPSQPVTFTAPLETLFSPVDLLDIFTCACEGGIDYWASIDQYHWQSKLNDQPVGDVTGFYAVITDVESDNAFPETRITRDTIILGLQRIASAYPERFRRLVLQQYDVDDADTLIQLALFNEVQFS